jgi:hypothetical protein
VTALIRKQEAHRRSRQVVGYVIDHQTSGPVEPPIRLEIGIVGDDEALGVQAKEHTTLPRGHDLVPRRIVFPCGLIEPLDDFA